jgi:hypothetical protein
MNSHQAEQHGMCDAVSGIVCLQVSAPDISLPLAEAAGTTHVLLVPLMLLVPVLLTCCPWDWHKPGWMCVH